MTISFAVLAASAAAAEIDITPPGTTINALVAVAGNASGETLVIWTQPSEEGEVLKTAIWARRGLTQPFIVGRLGFSRGVAAASDGHDFLVASTSWAGLVGTTVGSQTAFPIASNDYAYPPTFIESPVIAWNGRAYVVSATAHTYVAYNERFAARNWFVSPLREVMPVDVGITANRVGCNSSAVCLFVWPGIDRLVATVVTGAERSTEVSIPSTAWLTVGDVAFDGRMFLVAWNEGRSIVVSRLTAGGNVLDERIVLGRGAHPTLTASGLVAWTDDSYLRTARLEADGTIDEIALPDDATGSSPFAVRTFLGDAIIFQRDGRIMLRVVDALARHRTVSAR